MLGIDLRTLAALRVGLAAILLIDLLGCLPDITAHYTDNGLLPRDQLVTKLMHDLQFSLHLMSGSW